MYIAEWKSEPESQNIFIGAELTVGVQKSFRAELFRIGINRLIVDHGPGIKSHSVKREVEANDSYQILGRTMVPGVISAPSKNRRMPPTFRNKISFINVVLTGAMCNSEGDNRSPAHQLSEYGVAIR
jgi:hypothetical protein